MDHEGGQKKCFRVFVEKLEGNKAIGRPRRRWDNNIEMVFREI
jgi:hypothetical protein